MFGNQILVFHVAPGVGPTSPGVSSTLPAAQWKRIHRVGHVGDVGITPGVADVAQAVAHYSGGRLGLRT